MVCFVRTGLICHNEAILGDTNGYIDQSASLNSGQLGRVVDL